MAILDARQEGEACLLRWKTEHRRSEWSIKFP
jgi:hypothetical protein